MAKKKVKTSPYDSSEYLDSQEAITAYMEEALATDDPAFIAKALGTVAAMEEARRGGLPKFDSIDALMNDLNADD